MGKKRVYGLDFDQVGRLLSLGTDGGGQAQDHNTSSKRTDEECPGSWIGRYHLLGVLGEGGMGVVYLAEQEHPMRRRLALKVIKPGMDSARVIARFEAERQALALLDHPNIAHVYDAGMTEGGRPYFVMEHVEGLSITDCCDENKLTIEQRLRLFQQICDAVQHAHQNGIIHRDLKPSNILVAAEADKATPKIIDFGVAKAVAAPLTERTLTTEDSHLLGTPEYMSPEQADMATDHIDTRSDVYSLGVLLYVLLTGALPFDSDTLRAGGIEHVRKTIRETDPKTPSTHFSKPGEQAAKVAENRGTQVTSLAKRLRRELEWIPLKAMRKDRAERYRSAAELADDIENYLHGAPLIAGPLGPGYRLKKFIRRNRVLVGGIAAVLVVLLAGIVVSTVFAVGQARARAEAERQARISEAVSNFLRNDLLASVDPSKARGQELTIRSFLANASESLRGRFHDEPLVEASIRGTLGWTYRMLSDLKAAAPHLEQALQIREEQLGQEHPKTLETMGQLAWVYFDQGRHEEAERLCAKEVEISRRIFGEEHPTTLTHMKFLGFAYMSLGRYDEAEQVYSKTAQIARRVLGQQYPIAGHFGMLYQKQGRYAEAEAMFSKQLEDMRQRTGDEHPYTLAYMTSLADAYRWQGRYSESEAQYLKALEIQRRVLGDEHEYALSSMQGIARLYTEEGRYSEAEQQFVKALETLRRVRREAHPAILGNANGLALLRTKQKQYDQAEVLFDEAFKGRQRELGDDHPDTLQTISDFGVLRREQQRYEEAEELLVRALEGKRKRLGPDHPATLESMRQLGVLYIAEEHYRDAEPLLLDAYNGRESKLGPEHPHTIDSLRELVRLYESCNKPDEAQKWRAKLMQTSPAKE